MKQLHFMGGEKGGVGKSVLSRILAQYLVDRNESFSVFDADRSHPAMLRYYRDYCSAVNLSRFSSADAIIEPAIDAGFRAAANNQDTELGPCLSLLERQRVKIWLGRCYAALDGLQQSWNTPDQVSSLD